ncbi:class I SAM-dependent methyltransferase [Acidimangrovimonas sediminis]|uniref:class I SAM-dependent methyltransferase n=1 Tax=Acidimangrovimonas sediminis TaxID=2056283 RepID=UPI000C80EE83|nr:class I SAM-dependent methyltransferase [Acidimangrovimonas sediminis]
MSADRETLAFYAGMAGEYAAKMGASSRRTRDLTAFAAALPSGGRVLDFGCGGGWASRTLVEEGFAVTALDPVAEMLDMLSDCAGIETIHGDIDALPKTAVYEGIWAHFSLQHIPREALPNALARLARALAPGGVIAIGIHEGSEGLRDSLDRLYNHWTLEALAGILAPEGVEVVAARRHPDKGFDGRQFNALHLRAVRQG